MSIFSDISELLSFGSAGGSGGAGESLLDRITKQNSAKQMSMQAAGNNFGGTPIQGPQQTPINLTKKQVASIQTSKDPVSLAGLLLGTRGEFPSISGDENNFGNGKDIKSGFSNTRVNRAARGASTAPIDLLLGKLGPIGRALNPVRDALGSVSNGLREAARNGSLGALAPNFQAGVQGADENALNKRFVEAQIAKLLGGETEESKIGAVDSGKFTPESLQEFDQTGDYSLLRPVAGDQPDFNQLVNELADDARSESKDFVIQRDAIRRIESVANDPSAAGDLALIFSFMKVQDPVSSVREGEFANAQNSAGVEGRVRALYNNLLSGERLTEPQRNDFLRTSQKLFNTAARSQQEKNKRFRQRGKNSGLSDVLIDPLLERADEIEVVMRHMTDEELEAIANQDATE